MTSPPQQPWQAPQNVWQQQPSYSASPQPPQLPQQTKRAGWGLGCAITAIVGVIALIVIGGLIGGGIYLYHLKGRIPGMHKEQFQTVQGLNRVMDLTRQRFGDTMGYQLGVGPESFSVDRVDPDNTQKMATYYWYSWRGHFEDPSSILDPSLMYPTGPVDLSKFDANAVVKVLHDAPNVLHVDPTAVKSTFLTIRAAKDGPPGAGTVEEEVMLDTKKGYGRVVLAPDGTVKSTSADF
jgi:hypothetical protein